MSPNLFSLTLEDAFMISSTVMHFVFRADLSPPFSYLPGQFITIHFEANDKLLKRSYSIANAPKYDNRIEFAASYVPNGPGTKLLFNLKIGDSIRCSGPFGRLVLKDTLPGRYIFVATSTGITPYLSMLDELKRRLHENPELQVIILQGIQKREDVLYAKEFIDFSKKYSQLTFRAHLSRETNEDLQAHEHTGYVQTAFPELSLDPYADMIYLCGNPAMIDDAFNYLKEKGFGIQQIVREKYISAPTR